MKEIDRVPYEKMDSFQQNLTFESAQTEFFRRNIQFNDAQMKLFGLVNKDNTYTNLALLLSDQCSHTIQTAVFDGTEQNHFRARKEFCGSLLKQMTEVYDYIDTQNRIYSTFEKLYRIDQRDYPETAVREALLNLIVHREYSSPAASYVNLYADRLEFISIGGLEGGMTLNDVMMGISICRNTGLTDIFYHLELISAYGTGISKIMNAYTGMKKRPEIQVSDHVFKIILPNCNTSSETTETASKTVEIREDDDKVLALLYAQGSVTRKEIQVLLGISQTTCGRLLKNMVECGQIIQKGKGKNIHYCPPG